MAACAKLSLRERHFHSGLTLGEKTIDEHQSEVVTALVLGGTQRNLETTWTVQQNDPAKPWSARLVLCAGGSRFSQVISLPIHAQLIAQSRSCIILQGVTAPLRVASRQPRLKRRHVVVQ